MEYNYKEFEKDMLHNVVKEIHFIYTYIKVKLAVLAIILVLYILSLLSKLQ